MSGEGMRAAGYPHGEVDARQWAEEFVRIFPDARPDRDTLLGWFANAIMTGYDRAKSEERAAPERGGLEPRNAQIDGAALAVPSTPEPSGLREALAVLIAADCTLPWTYAEQEAIRDATVPLRAFVAALRALPRYVTPDGEETYLEWAGVRDLIGDDDD